MRLIPAFTRRDTLRLGAAGIAFAAMPGFALAQAAPPPAPAAAVDVKALMAEDALPDIVVGKADAPVTMVEYASMTCSHCARFHTETFPTLMTKYIDTGKVKFILREFPIDALAVAAFMLARCSGDKRTAMVDLLFNQQANWAFVKDPIAALEGFTKQTGMSSEAFKTCIDDRKLYENVMKVRTRGGTTFGVDATPTFFINGQRRSGEIPVGELDNVLAPFFKS